MNRFGQPRLRGAPRSKPYSTRPPAPGARSGVRGSAPSQRSGGGQFGSYQNNGPRSNSGASLLGDPPTSSPGYGGGGGMYSGGNSRNSGPSTGEPPVPSEVRNLMNTLGLSQSDMRKLSQLPEDKLSVNNLARAIGDLREGKHEYGGRPNPDNRPDMNRRGQRGSFGNDDRGMPGPRHGPREDFPPSRNEDFSPPRNSQQNRSFPSNNRRPSGIMSNQDDREFNRSGGYMDSGPRFNERRQLSRNDDDDDYYDEPRTFRRSLSPDRFDRPRNDSFPQNNRRLSNRNINDREVDQRQNYDDRRMDRGRPEQRDNVRRGGPPRPVGTRNLSKAINQQAPRSGNSRSRTQNLDSLMDAVGGNSASLLTPLMLASQTDPSVLEAQIQAMKALQAHAIQMKQGPYPNRRGGSRERDGPPPPRRRSPQPLSRAAVIDRRLEEEARQEAQEMRSARGRVLYIKYKSPRIVEGDLKRMAAPHGKITKLLIIKPKIPNGHFQAFMEMEQWTSAADMLERYMAKAPSIKGCPVDVKRSNYVDLHLREDTIAGNKRLRSISPIREGTTQLPHKRDRKMSLKGKLSITADSSDRRVVTRASREKDSESPEIDPAKTKMDAREILNQSRNKKDAKDGDTDDSSVSQRKTRWSKPSPERSSSAKPSTNDDGDSAKAADKNNDTLAAENMDVEESADPLDALANELALNDEFSLMDEESHDKEKETETANKTASSEDVTAKDEEKKADLERTDLDLDNVNVDEQTADENQKTDTEDSKTNLLVEGNEANDPEKSGSFDENEENANAFISAETNLKEKIQDEENKQPESVTDEDILKDSLDEPTENADGCNESVERGDVLSGNNSFMDDAQRLLDEAGFGQTGQGDEENPVEECDYAEDDLQEEDLLDAEEQGPVLDTVAELRSAMDDSLKEVLAAKEHVIALTKVTKAKAALALAKKISACLEMAESRLEREEST